MDFTIPEPEKLNTSISAQSNVDGNRVTITVDVDLNATGFVEIGIAGGKYYAAVVNGTAVFINDYSSGSYVANLTYLGDEIYNKKKSEENVSFNVKQDVPDFRFDVRNVILRYLTKNNTIQLHDKLFKKYIDEDA